jgi:hypothetical protein
MTRLITPHIRSPPLPQQLDPQNSLLFKTEEEAVLNNPSLINRGKAILQFPGS